MHTIHTRARLLLGAAALLFLAAAKNNCQPNDLPNDPGSGAIADAPEKEWTWVDVDGAVCADGSPTGLGLSPGTSDTLFIYLQGGGGCWDEDTCVTNPVAANLDGYGLDDLAGEQLLLNLGPFARGDLANPFRDASMVFVPYCTGDVHAGDAVTNYGATEIHHKGYANMALHLDRIIATFPDVSQVVLAGTSAGGIGALFNAERVQDAFGAVPVYVISDAGILLPKPYMSEELDQAFRSSWNLGPNLESCSACEDDLSAIYSHVASINPRVGVISKKQDSVITQYLDISLAEYEEGLHSLGPTFDQRDNLSYFVDAGVGHVMFIGWGTTTAGGRSLRDWTRQMVTDDPSWGSVID